MKNSGAIIASLVGGLLIGSAITMLVTPHSGPEMRRKIRKLIEDEVQRVRNKCTCTDPCECDETCECGCNDVK